MFIKVSEQGNIIEVTYMLNANGEARIRKISQDEYVRLEDGEVCEFQHSENRADLKQSLYRTFRKIRGLINTNFTGSDRELLITLTYAENMRDAKRLYSDFDKFMKRFRYKFGKMEYIAVAEPQGRGAWHMHVLALWPCRAPFVENAVLAECWGHGFVNVKRVGNVDNIGAYLSAYLADAEVPLEHPNGVMKTFADGTKKKYVKGGRLNLYPTGMNIYRCSRGIKKPEERQVTEYEKNEIVNGAKLTYKNKIQVTFEDGFKQQIVKEYYNRKRI